MEILRNEPEIRNRAKPYDIIYLSDRNVELLRSLCLTISRCPRPLDCFAGYIVTPVTRCSLVLRSLAPLRSGSPAVFRFFRKGDAVSILACINRYALGSPRLPSTDILRQRIANIFGVLTECAERREGAVGHGGIQAGLQGDRSIVC